MIQQEDTPEFIRAMEAVVDFRSKNGTHFSWEQFQVFLNAYKPGWLSYPEHRPEVELFMNISRPLLFVTKTPPFGDVHLRLGHYQQQQLEGFFFDTYESNRIPYSGNVIRFYQFPMPSIMNN